MREYIISDESMRTRASTIISNLPIAGQRWKLTIAEASEKRRDSQNRLLWRWNNEIQ